MSVKTRRNLIEKIEKIRERPLIVFITSVRPGCNTSMEQDSIVPFIRQIEKIPKSAKKVDIMILSNGGDPMVSWRLISLLRERFEEISVLVPFSAFSAATLFALGANEIIMHPYGNLGPIDPQITIGNGMPNNTKHFSYEDIVNYTEFLKSIGITDQELIQRCFDKLINEVPPTALGFARRASQLGLMMGEKLLSTHLEEKNTAKTISQALNSKFYDHGYSLNRKEAKAIGLPIVEEKEELNKLMWSLAKDYISSYSFNDPFVFDDHISNHIKTNDLKKDERKTFDIDLFSSCIESKYLSCIKNYKFTIMYLIDKDLNIKKNLVSQKTCWSYSEEKGKN